MRKYLVLGLILVFGLIGTNSYGASEWDKTRPAITDQKIDYPVAVTANNEALDRVLANYREGATISYLSTSTVSVSAGEIVCSNAAGSLKKFRQNTSATTVTWADIDTGSEANSTTYTVFAVADADAATFTIKISASASAPSGATYYKKLGSFYNNADGNIRIINNSNFIFEYGDKQSKTVGTTYQALTDGVVVFIGSDTEPCRGQLMKLYSDGSATPTTVVGIDYSGADQGSGGTLTFPVKTGDYYKGTWSTQAGDSCSATGMYFIPKQ